MLISEAKAALVAKKVSSRELVDHAAQAIAAHQDLNAFITTTFDRAKSEASEWDRRRLRGEDTGVLGGIPVALKDLLLTPGVRTTCASKILENFIPPYEASCVTRLKANGGISLGKLNMDEFAMGSSNENSAFGVVKNPWDPERTPGGSSGGSAAAVAANLVAATLGSDTGGSIREPAAFTGIVGLKPTYGRVSRYGVIAFASSLDQVGPLTQSVEDAALMLQAIGGHDPKDATSATQAMPSFADLHNGMNGATLGVPNDKWLADLTPDMAKAFADTVGAAKAAGAKIVQVDITEMQRATQAYYVICTAEASSNLARFDGSRFGASLGREHGLQAMYKKTRSEKFGREVQRRILLGTFVLSSGYYDAYYNKALNIRAALKAQLAQAFTTCDAILLPTTPYTAFKLGEKITDPTQMYLADIYTVMCNLAGLPGISIPVGLCSKGLPIGMQLMGRAFDESTLLRCARALEKQVAFSARAKLRAA